ncbi:NADPH-dependent FMN reductase [Streptomyces sp. NPDC050418]|uniref:NADPH-dependent FMN reductase n=1 Tax=Streptomyces sp. NPDC050418 TaxID=3365612 RepID=UPI0037A1BD1C
MTARLLVISASTRPTSAGRPLAQWLAERATGHAKFETTLVDLGELALPFFDEPGLPADGGYVHQHTKDWSSTVSAADAFLFVLPMYNGGFTAPLKNAVDFLYAEWQGKPVGLVSYSAGTSGGAPALAMLHPVLTRVGLRPAPCTLSVPAITELVGSAGEFRAPAHLAASADTVLDSVGDLLAAPVAA